MAWPAMAIPSSTEWGSLSRTERSMKAPGSPSSALQITYFCLPGGPSGEAPLHPGEEARPPAPTQPGVDDQVDEAVGVLLAEDALEGLVPAHLQVLLDLLRVDHAAVAQHDALLAVEEGILLALAVARPDQPLLDGLALLDVLFEQPVDPVGGHLPVLPARPVVLAQLHERLAIAHPHAAGLLNLAAVAPRPRLGQDRGVGRPGARRDPARAEPHQDPHEPASVFPSR